MLVRLNFLNRAIQNQPLEGITLDSVRSFINDYSTGCKAKIGDAELCSGNMYYLNNKILRLKKQAENGLFLLGGE